jgi:O-6-methylguanine DNA methyltransferase
MLEIFPTRIGPMEAHWQEGKLKHLHLRPQAQPEQPHSELARRVQSHLAGQPQDFRATPLVEDGLSPFALKVYRAAQEIPPGKVASYGELATAFGSPGATRAVGTALGRNPFLLVVPCHRVTASSGPGGFSAPGGLATKSLILAAEGYGVESLWQPGSMEEGFAQLACDDRLGAVVRAVGPCPLQPLYPQHPFAALARNVLFQQLAGSAARAIEARVKALGSPPFPSAEELLSLAEESLRGAGLSGPKIAALRALSQAVLEGSLRVDELALLPDAQVVSEICKVKGLGSWSAEIFLMFHLGRRDLLPVKDLGIRKGFQRLFGLSELPDAAQMERKARPWRPYRSLASWYLWRSLEL